MSKSNLMASVNSSHTDISSIADPRQAIATWQNDQVERETPESMVHNIFEGALSQTLNVVEMLQQENLRLKRQAVDLESTIDTLRTDHESQIRDLEMSQAEMSAQAAAQAEAAFDEMRSEMEGRIGALQIQMREQKDAQEAEIRQLKVSADKRLAEIEAFWEDRLNVLEQRKDSERRAMEEEFHTEINELNANSMAAEEQWRQRVEEVEDVWTKKYNHARKQVESQAKDIRAFKQKQLDARHQDLESLEVSGKSMAQMMEEAMRLIKKAQEDSVQERLRLGHQGLLASADDVKENENLDIPSPTSIRASYSRKLSAPIPIARTSAPRTSTTTTSPAPLRSHN